MYRTFDSYTNALTVKLFNFNKKKNENAKTWIKWLHNIIQTKIDEKKMWIKKKENILKQWYPFVVSLYLIPMNSISFCLGINRIHFHFD